VQIVVQDTGRGISAEFLPHVFERFRQENSSMTREVFGLGVGLSIAKHLVEAHGGTIDARSEGRGLGATFTVKLPVAAPAAMVGGPEAGGPEVSVTS
jgi:two-component system CheB/CheR fusion protein